MQFHFISNLFQFAVLEAYTKTSMLFIDTVTSFCNFDNYLSKQFALWPLTQIGELTFDHQMAVFQEDIEESSSWKLSLDVNHQLKKALAEIYLGEWDFTCNKCSVSEFQSLFLKRYRTHVVCEFPFLIMKFVFLLLFIVWLTLCLATCKVWFKICVHLSNIKFYFKDYKDFSTINTSIRTCFINAQ